MIELKDNGNKPFVANIPQAAFANQNFRLAFWTGKHLQMTLMSLKMREEIGAEVHSHLDQYIRVEGGTGLVQMGESRDSLDFLLRINQGDGLFVRAGT